MKNKEYIQYQLQSMADDLRNASNWAEIDRLSEKIEDIITEIEELL